MISQFFQGVGDEGGEDKQEKEERIDDLKRVMD